MKKGSGVNFHFGTEVTGIERGGGGSRYTIALAQEKKIETDLVVVGIGVNPNTELVASAGLVVNGGILVDQNLSTSDANISAIGDCVAFPTPTRPSPSGSSLFRMQRIRPAVPPCALSEKVHLIEACRGFAAIKDTISYR
jgi:3-phenylpropionate/trans-cinnamate dioxygenase ferredoxin reductase subunit